MSRQIEDYLRARGVQYFRGHHDDEYFFFVDFPAGAYGGRLSVHIEVSDAEPEDVLVTISPDRYYPAENVQWLGMVADHFNAGDPVVRAVVHGSCDPRLVGVQARSRHQAADVVGLGGFVEAAVAGAMVVAWLRGELDELAEDDGSEWDVREGLHERDEW